MTVPPPASLRNKWNVYGSKEITARIAQLDSGSYLIETPHRSTRS